MGAQGWLQSWFGGSPAGPSGHSTLGHRRTTSGEVQAATGLDLGIAQAFVKFMETECYICDVLLAKAGVRASSHRFH